MLYGREVRVVNGNGEAIARTLWGDASLWWKLADVNGLAAQGPDSRLTEGQSLSIPGQVSGLHNTAQTHKPYDPTEVVGDTTPNMPAPPVNEGGGGGCGILGKIIMIVVAVAVTAVTGGAGGAVSSFWGGVLGQGSAAAAVATAATAATAAAAGSVASQAVGVAIGAQSKFSWKNVALAAISGGVSGGLAEVNFTGGDSLYSLGNTVIRSALGNTISQGIGVATGLQKSFDWKSVAGAAVGAGVGWGVGQALGSNANTLAGASLRSFAAGAATALVRGGKISITQVAVDAFGSALGDGLGATLRASLAQSQSLGQSQGSSPGFMGGGAGGAGADGGYSSFGADTSNFGPSAQETFRASEIAAQNQGAGAWDAMDGYADALPGDNSNSLYGLGTPGSVGGLGLQARGGLGLSAAGQRATGDEQTLGGLDDRNGMDVQSDQYDGRYRTATVQKGQGPLAALADLGLDAQQQRAGYGYLLATGQVKLDRNGVPMVQPGQQLTIDLSDNRYGNTAGQAIAQESGLRAQREQQLAAQQAAETAQSAQENQESWDQMRMAWGGRTGTQGPVWHLGGGAQAQPTAAQAGGRTIDVVSTDALGNPTGGMQQEWVSDKPSSSWSQSVGNALQTGAMLIDGAVQLGVNGVVNGMWARPVSGAIALPAAALMGPEAYTAIQADLQERMSLQSNNPGAIAIQQSLGQMLQPVGQALGELRTASENRFGDGATTAGFAIAQGALEVAGFVGGVAAIPGGRAALGSLGGSIQGGFNTLADAMPMGSGAGGLRGPGLQWGAVGDLEGLGGTTGASVAGTTTARVSSRPEWLARLDEGNAFNAERSTAYPHNEVYINSPKGTGYTRLDSYNPVTGEIVSRKFTQFSEIQEQTGISYINELPAKYPVNGIVANVPSSGVLAGRPLLGQYYLEVPVQNRPVPQSIINAADRAGVIIRDVNGGVY